MVWWYGRWKTLALFWVILISFTDKQCHKKKQKEVKILKNLVLFNKIVVIFMALFVSLTVVNWKIINIFPSQSLQNVSLFSEITQIAFFFSIQAERQREQCQGNLWWIKEFWQISFLVDPSVPFFTLFELPFLFCRHRWQGQQWKFTLSNCKKMSERKSKNKLA